MNLKFINLILIFFAQYAMAAPLFKNLDSYKTSLGFRPYYNKAMEKKLKVAVLDKGFFGYESEIGKTLPAGTQYFAGPLTAPEDLKVEHGLKMAQIFTAMVSDDLKSPDLMPELFLYNVFGYTNFKAAIDDIIAKKIDLVLYSETWEYGGNHDGLGFINKEVSRATSAGVIWINNAGNFQTTTYNSKINTIDENWVDLPDENHGLKFTCQLKSKKFKCGIKIVLTWNDFKDDVELGSDKDLDLALFDDMLNVLHSNALKQSSDSKEERPGYSKYPREIISAEIPQGTYYLKVKNRSNNFTAHDELRITIDGVGVEIPKHSTDETLLNPADNASVITVGATDSDRSGQSLKLAKPEVFSPSAVILMNGDELRGSSNSAAILAAGVALLKGLNPSLTKDSVLQQLQESSSSVGGNSTESQFGLSLYQLGFWFTGPNCFFPAQVSPQQIAAYPMGDLNRMGAVFVQTNIGIKIMVPFDPIQMVQGGQRYSPNDMVVITRLGMALFTRNGPKPYESVEVFQRPLEAGLCYSNGSGSPQNPDQGQGPQQNTNRGSFRMPYLE